MTDGVEVLGYGIHPFGRFPDKLPSELASSAIEQALRRAGVARDAVEVVYTGHTVADSGGGTAVLAAAGIRGVPILNLDQACASSASAVALAVAALSAGQAETALVVGFEKMGSGFLRQSRPHQRREQLLGFDLQPANYALKASRYLASYGGDEKLLAGVTVKSRRHAAANPEAHLRTETTLGEVLESPMIASPLTRLQCCPTSDGAAAVVLGRRRPGAPHRHPSVVACVLGTLTADEALSCGVPESFTARLARSAYEAAGIGAEDVGVAQVHDAFTIAEPLRLEALGLVPEGEGLDWNERGMTSIGGRIPTNTDGGLLSRGHPVGATGVAQLIEVVRQVAGEAGERQVEPVPTVGVCQNLGGGENGGGVVMVVVR
ncbi:MAG TPA: thiolase family protein [Acidimicrobiales bacterium]|nr:thiolase family protein [Acidimicrobiales bacterium]